MLPIAKTTEASPWTSGPWLLRSERCYLVPGDSPIGFRLPLDSLPWVRPTDFPHVYPPDPNQSFEELAKPAPDHATRERERDDRRTDAAIARAAGAAAAARRRGAAGDCRRRHCGRRRVAAPPESTVRTSMCAEERDGVLYVFMPPTRCLEDYLELVGAVESSAALLRQPVIIEGYEPPADPRLINFKVTPDPGVIEVNVQPSAGWDELAAHTQDLYADAAACKLRSEKFMIDGRHTGTGGGNHIVMGGRHSPRLARSCGARICCGA